MLIIGAAVEAIGATLLATLDEVKNGKELEGANDELSRSAEDELTWLGNILLIAGTPELEAKEKLIPAETTEGILDVPSTEEELAKLVNTPEEDSNCAALLGRDNSEEERPKSDATAKPKETLLLLVSDI